MIFAFGERQAPIPGFPRRRPALVSRPAHGTSAPGQAGRGQAGEIFEREVTVFMSAPGHGELAGADAGQQARRRRLLGHKARHTAPKDECGAPEYFSGGARLAKVPQAGSVARIPARAQAAAIAAYPAAMFASWRPTAVTITQFATEIGTIYSLGDIRAISRSLPR